MCIRDRLRANRPIRVLAVRPVLSRGRRRREAGMAAGKAGIGRPAADNWDWALPLPAARCLRAGLAVPRDRLVPSASAWPPDTCRSGTPWPCAPLRRLPPPLSLGASGSRTLGEAPAPQRLALSTCALRPAAKKCVRGIRAAPGILAGRRGWRDRREAGVAARATTTDSGQGRHFPHQITANAAYNGQRYGPEQPLHTAHSGQYGS